MSHAWFRFYAELNDFIPVARRQTPFVHEFEGRTSIKDLIESLGVPHTEVDLVLVNARSVDFGYIVQPGDRISVYPVFEAFDIGPVTRVRAAPLRDTRFVSDSHLGRLSAYLRLAGFDTLYDPAWHDAALADLSARQHRILLTRDLALLKRSAVTHGYYVRETAVRRQLVEVLRRFDLARRIDPFTRCLRCNTPVRAVAKAEVIDRLPPRTRACHDTFSECPGCGRVYWPGSHYAKMRAVIEDAVGEAGEKG